MEEETQEELKTVMIFGVFDRLHDGHHFFIDQAMKLGTHLAIVVARDASVLLYKKRNPEHSENERVLALKHAYPEALVVLGDEEENSWNIIEVIQPDVIALGYDQKYLHEALQKGSGDFSKIPDLIVIPDSHRGDELHSSLLRKS